MYNRGSIWDSMSDSIWRGLKHFLKIFLDPFSFFNSIIEIKFFGKVVWLVGLKASNMYSMSLNFFWPDTLWPKPTTSDFWCKMGPSKRLQPAAVACCICTYYTRACYALVPAALTSWLNFERSRLLAGSAGRPSSSSHQGKKSSVGVGRLTL